MSEYRSTLDVRIPHVSDEYLQALSSLLSYEFSEEISLYDILGLTNASEMDIFELISEVENEVSDLRELVLTIYVDNPKIRKIFASREENGNPLPMVCVPHFEQKGPNKATNFKPISVPDDEFVLSVSPRKKELNYVLFQGICGDFVGYHEKVPYRKFLMPIIEKEIVPTYRKGYFAFVSFLSPSIKINPYPQRNRNFTYRFTAPFKIFESYGLEISGPGTEFVFKFEEEKSQVMRGDVTLYFSKRIDRLTPVYQIAKYDIWFAKFVYLLDQLAKHGKPNVL